MGAALADNAGLYEAAVVDLEDKALLDRYASVFRPLVKYNKFNVLGGQYGLLEFLMEKRFKKLGRGEAVLSVTPKNTYG